MTLPGALGEERTDCVGIERHTGVPVFQCVGKQEED